MVAPATLLMAAVLGAPMLVGIAMSFQHIRLNRPADFQAFVGLANYVEMLTDADFYSAVFRSLVYTVGVVGLSYCGGLLMAVLLNRRFPGRGFFRSLFMLPWVVPLVASVLVWGVMLDPHFGLVNKLLSWVPGLPSGTAWLLNPTTAFPALIVVDAWNQFPLAALFLLAGLQAIPEELYEAASVDGANAWQQLWAVTVPSLKSVSLVTLLLMTIWAFRRFDVIFLLTGGGPGKATETLIIQTYNEAFVSYKFSYAATLGVASLVISLLFAVAYLRMRRREET